MRMKETIDEYYNLIDCENKIINNCTKKIHSILLEKTKVQNYNDLNVGNSLLRDAIRKREIAETKKTLYQRFIADLECIDFANKIK